MVRITPPTVAGRSGSKVRWRWLTSLNSRRAFRLHENECGAYALMMERHHTSSLCEAPMWRARLLSIVTVLSLAATRTVIAQTGAEPTGPNFHKIISLDSMQFRGLGASPGGRWLT